MKPILAGSLCLWMVMGCANLTLEEAKTAVEEIQLVSQTAALTSNSIEIGTQFTIQDGLEQAAQQIRDFVATQLPCAEVTLEAATLTIAYGAKAGNCSYHGQTFSGTHAIQVVRNGNQQVEVSHTWTDFSNGLLEVDGSATVTWDFGAKSRHVVHQASWTRLADGRSCHE